MQYLIGFFIALFIALTGVGAGTITVPVLVLFLGVPAPVAWASASMFSAAVKLILASGADCAPQRGLAHAGIHAAGRRAGRARRVAVPEASGQRRIGKPAERDSGRHSGGHGELADLLFLPSHAAELRQRGTAARCSRGSCFRSARRWVFLPPEQARWAAPRCSASLRWRPRRWSAPISPSASWFRSSAAARIGSRTPAIPRCCCNSIVGGVAGAVGGTLLSTRVPRRPLRFALWVWLLILGGAVSLQQLSGLGRHAMEQIRTPVFPQRSFDQRQQCRWQIVRRAAFAADGLIAIRFRRSTSATVRQKLQDIACIGTVSGSGESLWLPPRDSNPDMLIQSQLSCR